MSILSIWRSFLSAVGSHSTDIYSVDTVDNPLPPCPNSPNCVRITKTVNIPLDSAFEACFEAINTMNPKRINPSKNDYRIDTVFKVFFFQDDMTVQLTERDSVSTFLHIRSSSRVGFSDLGVNTRRVKQFWRRLQGKL